MKVWLILRITNCNRITIIQKDSQVERKIPRYTQSLKDWKKEEIKRNFIYFSFRIGHRFHGLIADLHRCLPRSISRSMKILLRYNKTVIMRSIRIPFTKILKDDPPSSRRELRFENYWKPAERPLSILNAKLSNFIPRCLDSISSSANPWNR